MSTTKKSAAKASVKKSTTKTATKPVTKEAAAAKAPIKATPKAEKEQMVLYTIRLAPSAVNELKARAAKQGVTHAAIARSYIETGLAKAA
jgi:predicted DNA binding CopG/RHH family protein